MNFNNLYDVENKQRLNLSDHAKAVLLNDLAVFQDKTELRLTSSFINRVFSCYRGEASSSVTASLRRKRLELEETLSLMDEKPRRIAIDCMLLKYEKQLKDRIRCWQKEKGSSIMIRIDENNLSYFQSKDGQQEGRYYNNKVGHYMKAVLEEYSEQTYAKRESVYFKEDLKTISFAIENQKLLKLTLRNRDKSSGHNHVLYVKPFDIRQDNERLYNYIVGLQSVTQDGPWKVGAVRLTSILKCRDLAESGRIKGEDMQRIRKALMDRGVQYLAEDQKLVKVVVQFTDQGENMYRRMLHLRPLYKSKNGLIYEFECTAYQAQIYFFKFGSHAKILEPQAMADDFKSRYLSAAEKYE